MFIKAPKNWQKAVVPLTIDCYDFKVEIEYCFYDNEGDFELNTRDMYLQSIDYEDISYDEARQLVSENTDLITEWLSENYETPEEYNL